VQNEKFPTFSALDLIIPDHISHPVPPDEDHF